MNILTSILILAFPMVVYASGGDVLNMIWLEVVVFVAVVILMVASDLALKFKAVVFFTYFISAIIPLWLTSELVYSKNIIFVNSFNAIIPIITCIIVWGLCVKMAKT